jgi:hypothetical protein
LMFLFAAASTELPRSALVTMEEDAGVGGMYCGREDVVDITPLSPMQSLPLPLLMCCFLNAVGVPGPGPARRGHGRERVPDMTLLSSSTPTHELYIFRTLQHARLPCCVLSCAHKMNLCQC